MNGEPDVELVALAVEEIAIAAHRIRAKFPASVGIEATVTIQSGEREIQQAVSVNLKEPEREE